MGPGRRPASRDPSKEIHVDQTKRTIEVSRDATEQAAPKPAPNEVRTLSELELVLCGGGDGNVNWG